MIILTGPSASGKTEVAKLLISKYGIVKVITHTTRTIRYIETADVDYHFVTVEEFKKGIEAGKFVEWTFYNGNYYGTSKAEIGRDKALIVDPNGVLSFQKLHDKSIVFFRLLAGETTRFNRMMVRGDEIEKIKSRISNDRCCFAEDKYECIDYTIDTDRYTIEEIADNIYKLYKDRINSL